MMENNISGSILHIDNTNVCEMIATSADIVIYSSYL